MKGGHNVTGRGADESIKGTACDRARRGRNSDAGGLRNWTSAATELEDDQLQLSENKFSDRWPLKNYYNEDLLAYLFRPAPQIAYMEQMGAVVDSLIPTQSFGQLIRLVAAAESSAILTDPLADLQRIVQVALPRHQRVVDFVNTLYDVLLSRWATIYEKISSGFGLSIRPGLTWMDVAILLNTVIEGAWMRANDGSLPKLSTGDGVLVGAIFAMLPSIMKDSPPDWDQLYAV